MNRKKNNFILILAAGVSIPLLIGLHLHFSQRMQDSSSLHTSMDVQAVETTLEPTATQTIDTVSGTQTPLSNQETDDNTKRKQVIALVNDAIALAQNSPFDKAMSAFTHGRDFVRGELYIFVYDVATGVQLANGQDERYVWKNMIDLKDAFGTNIVQELIKKAKSGGGWVTYQWRNATKVSYVKLLLKDGREYVVGAGYYPHSKRDIVIGLVKAAVAYFNDVVIKKGFPVDEVFSTLSYPAGRFVMGDLYLYALDFNGQMMANGDRPGLIGTNVLSVKDAEGKFVNQEIINALKNSEEGIWTEYKSKNATKVTYAEKVTDANGKNYFIACGYYPSATPQKAVDLVKNGYEFMKKSGLSAAVNEFTSRQADTFRYGDLYLIVWDMKGKVVAHGANLDAVGINQFDLKDEDGKFYVQEIIEKAKRGGGWIDFKMKNAFQSIYVEKVELGSDNFVIGSGLYPISKRETAILLARSAAGYLRGHTEFEAFGSFTDTNGKFIRGDLYVFVVEADGICNVWGDTYELIWRNIMSAKDDNGKPYIQVFINTVKQGPGQVTYKINGFERVALIEPLEKDGKNYVVGTAYYL